MIEIKIEGQLLYIAKNTSLQLEVNNSAFSVSGIEGDIVFTFEVSAMDNDLIFKQARFIYVQRCKKYLCIVSVDGIEIAAGDLYIQKSTDTSYACGLVINPFPEDFSEKKLSENNYGDNYIISATSGGLKTGWLSMLASSLQEDAIFKFFLFIDTVFYGSANKDFGWFLLPNDPAPPGNQSGFQASINTNDNVGLDRCYVNRLFTNASGSVIEALSGNRGVRIFNNNALNNPNSFAFAPAIQLLWILENVIKNGGYQMIGNFREENNIKKIYSQSMRALDGLASQTENPDSAKATISFSPTGTFIDEIYDDEFMPFETNNAEHYFFIPPTTQNYQINVSIKTYLPANLLREWTVPNEPNFVFKEVLMFFIIDHMDPFPDWILWSSTDEWNGKVGNMRSGDFTYFNHFYKIYNRSQLQSQMGYNGAGYYTFNFPFTQRLTGSRYYGFFFGKVTLASSASYQAVMIDKYQRIEFINNPETIYSICNVFANKIKFAEHVPALTNSDFISNICNAFGLSMFIDSAKGQIELSFFKDILNHAQAIDLSQYLLTKKSYIEKYEPKKYRYKFDALSSEDIDETKILPSVKTCSQLPDAYGNYGKICFVENENRYRIAVRAGDSVQNWVFRWEAYSGNNQMLEIGEGDSEDITPLKIPNMKIADERITNSHHLLNIEVEGCSPIFDTGSKEFDMILVNYLGRKPSKVNNSCYYEHAAPVCLNSEGNREQGIDLTATGEHSVGETYAAPWLRFLASHEKVCHYFLLPATIFMEVLQLLKPQDVPISNQKRFVI
ncbi:MAG: hypothetical protein FWD09_08225, partial [Lentimicrobiaceae bacterium]|nr:hypothetical protein [Lentimicrobiaceae bacterium]